MKEGLKSNLANIELSEHTIRSQQRQDRSPICILWRTLRFEFPPASVSVPERISQERLLTPGRRRLGHIQHGARFEVYLFHLEFAYCNMLQPVAFLPF
jgi:hypothetical protein